MTRLTIALLSALLSLVLLGATGSAADAQPHRSLSKSAAPVTDDTITDQVRLKLGGDPVLKGGALNVDVKMGVVTLSGTVAQEKQRTRAERLARKVKGVKQVIDKIAITKPGGH
jgi:hyperosmotically inducible protein